MRGWSDAAGTAGATRKTSAWVREQLKPGTPLEAKRTQLGLSSNAGKNGRQQEKRKTECELDRLSERSQRPPPTGAEQGCGGQGTVAAAPPPGRQGSEPTRWHGTHVLAQMQSHASAEREGPALPAPCPSRNRARVSAKPRERRPRPKGRGDERREFSTSGRLQTQLLEMLRGF